MVRQGQSTVEYLFLIGLAAASLISMAVYMKRGYQGYVRNLSDQIGSQFSPYGAQINTLETKNVATNTLSLSQTTTIYYTANGDNGDNSTTSNSLTTSNTQENTVETVAKTIFEAIGSLNEESWR